MTSRDVIRVPNLPLMEPIQPTPFWAIFKQAKDKQQKLRQLERALNLFIDAINKHELDADLKFAKVNEATKLRGIVLDEIDANLQGRRSQAYSQLLQLYQISVNTYTDTTAELVPFENEFKNLWYNPPKEAVPGPEPNVDSQTNVPLRTISKKPSSISRMRKIFGNALSRTLLNRRERAESDQANQDWDVFHEELASELTRDPEAMASLQPATPPGLNIASNDGNELPVNRQRQDMRNFQYPARSTQETNISPNYEYNRVTFDQPVANPAHNVLSAVTVAQRTSVDSRRTQLSEANESIITNEFAGSPSISSSTGSRGQENASIITNDSQGSASIITNDFAAGPSNVSIASSTSGLDGGGWTRTHTDLTFVLEAESE
ncbi:hypothetical protein BDN70DRAFT_996406 [Pholiota conissans]|uniref:Uncharacterized protein n=1 Tax=Pholiota conissans TaxID=109636 RepID=A0A9P6CWP1_9AGAR|nr:hypothetical protein BDN70DRAFT_996406 [Pholiota conissans]